MDTTILARIYTNMIDDLLEADDAIASVAGELDDACCIPVGDVEHIATELSCRLAEVREDLDAMGGFLQLELDGAAEEGVKTKTKKTACETICAALIDDLEGLSTAIGLVQDELDEFHITAANEIEELACELSCNLDIIREEILEMLELLEIEVEHAEVEDEEEDDEEDEEEADEDIEELEDDDEEPEDVIVIEANEELDTVEIRVSPSQEINIRVIVDEA